MRNVIDGRVGVAVNSLDGGLGHGLLEPGLKQVHAPGECASRRGTMPRTLRRSAPRRPLGASGARVSCRRASSRGLGDGRRGSGRATSRISAICRSSSLMRPSSASFGSPSFLTAPLRDCRASKAMRRNQNSRTNETPQISPDLRGFIATASARPGEEEGRPPESAGASHHGSLADSGDGTTFVLALRRSWQAPGFWCAARPRCVFRRPSHPLRDFRRSRSCLTRPLGEETRLGWAAATTSPPGRSTVAVE